MPQQFGSLAECPLRYPNVVGADGLIAAELQSLLNREQQPVFPPYL